MKGNPAMPGGPLTSKPTWSNTLPECSTTSAFFVSRQGHGRQPNEVNSIPVGSSFRMRGPTLHFEGSVGARVPDKEFHDEVSHEMA
jgi:hypothetical protein